MASWKQNRVSCILFAWEMGANLGHLTRDLPLARACREAGHEVIFAVANLRIADSLLRAERFTLVQAPLLRPSRKRSTPPLNYADMLLHQGYDDPDALAGALAGWCGLFELVRPALLVYNHAPTALLAARMTRLPNLLVGTGFEIPPAVTPLPGFHSRPDSSPSILREAEARVLDCINPHLMASGQASLSELSDLFPPTQVQLATFAELDPFGPRPDADYIGPIHSLPPVPSVSWQCHARPKVFAYLHPDLPGCTDLLEALQTLDAEVICALPGVPEAWKVRFDRIHLLSHPADLAALLPQTDLVVTYGAGTIATTLLAGVPVLLVPWVVEQYLAGLALERTGAGRMLRGQRTLSHCSAMLSDVLNHADYRLAARGFAQRHREFSHAGALQKQWQAVTRRLERLAGPL